MTQNLDLNNLVSLVFYLFEEMKEKCSICSKMLYGKNPEVALESIICIAESAELVDRKCNYCLNPGQSSKPGSW